MRVERIYQVLGVRLRLARELVGITQEDLARAVGISRPSIVNIEKGRQRIALHHFVRIADVLGLNVGRLLGAPSRGKRASWRT